MAQGKGQGLHTPPGAETPHFPGLTTSDKDKPGPGALRQEFYQRGWGAEPLTRIPPCSPGKRARRCSNRSGQPAASLTPHSCSGPVMRQSRCWGATRRGGRAPSPGGLHPPGTAIPLESPPPASTFQASEFIAEGSAGKAGPRGRWVGGRRRVQAPL